MLMSAGTQKFVDVILPNSLPGMLTYSVPEVFLSEIEVGKRVLVQLGKQKVYAALIRHIHENPPSAQIEFKQILSVIDEKPLVTQDQFRFWDWMSFYYMAKPGEIMTAAFPSALRLQSETKISLNPEYNHDHHQLTDQEYLIYEALLLNETLSTDDVEKILKKKNALRIVKAMLDKGVVIVDEEVQERFKQKTEKHLKLNEKYEDEKVLAELFDELEKKFAKQLHVLMSLIHHTGNEKGKSISKSKLMSGKDVSASAVKTLIEKRVLDEVDVLTDRIKFQNKELILPNVLNPSQEIAFEKIQQAYREKDVTLLHGDTASGKTEIYIHLMQQMMLEGKQVLYLLPEISLTIQLVERIQNVFGKAVGVYHSRFNQNERVEIWNKMLSNDAHQYRIIIGARSALFLPFKKLGLVIVDEEHDSSYKQHDPSPRYSGRDAAIVLAKQHEAKVLLGSATPSLDSYYNAQQKKYELISLKGRFNDAPKPGIRIEDVKMLKEKKLMKSHFSPLLIDNIQQKLDSKEQVILFQNRRGFVPVIECQDCGWTPLCKNCTVTLTYHKHSNLLKCHYCGYAQQMPSACIQCQSHHLKMQGFGTEKIEEEIALFFPKAKIARMDMDSMRGKFAYRQLITDFSNREIDILVGTQMLTKGLDFEHVGLVAVLNSDQLLNFPDYKAHEKAFQLMCQVAGRAGRRKKRGDVIIQSMQPTHPVLKEVVENDFHEFYQREMDERRRFEYPPFSRLISLTLKHKDKDQIAAGAEQLVEMLKKVFGNRIYGPHDAIVSRVKTLWQKNILLKMPKDTASSNVRKSLKEALDAFFSQPTSVGVLLSIDVDP